MSKIFITILVGLSNCSTIGNAQNNDLKVEYIFTLGEDTVYQSLLYSLGLLFVGVLSSV